MDLEKDTFGFSEALELAKDGWIIGNEEWGEERTFYSYSPKRFQTVDLPYLCIKDENFGISPWQPDQIDLFSEHYYKVQYTTSEFQ